MSEDKKTKYRGFTPAQAEAHKRYMKDFIEIKVRMKAEKRSIVQAHAASMGESMNSFVVRAIDETMKHDTGAPIEAIKQPPTAPAALLPAETLKEAQNAAGVTGETVSDFVTRAVKTQAKRDEAAQNLGLDPVTGEILKTSGSEV